MDDLADDLLDGMRAIAGFLKISERRGYHLAEKRLIPAFKQDDKWCALKSVLRQHYQARGKAALEASRVLIEQREVA